jgi:WXG100 family type VII secretion target
MSIQVDHEAFDRANRLVSDIGDGLHKEHRKVSADVADLLGSSWHGVAATQFGQAWAEWVKGMDDILAGISLQNALLGVVRADMDRTDSARQAAATYLHARLGDLQ